MNLDYNEPADDLSELFFSVLPLRLESGYERIVAIDPYICLRSFVRKYVRASKRSIWHEILFTYVRHRLYYNTLVRMFFENRGSVRDTLPVRYDTV